MIPAESCYIPPDYHILDFESWFPHADSQCLRFIAACHYTSVVIAKHHNRASFQRPVKCSLATYEEIITVSKAYHLSDFDCNLLINSSSDKLFSMLPKIITSIAQFQITLRTQVDHRTAQYISRFLQSMGKNSKIYASRIFFHIIHHGLDKIRHL